MMTIKLPGLAMILTLLVVLCINCSSPADSDGIKEAENQRPVITRVTGTTQAVIGVEYEYTAVGYDPDGDVIKYHFGTWPEGRYDEAYTNWGYTDYLKNNVPGTMKIIWKDTGPGYLCVHVVDDQGVDSQPHTIITIQVNDKE
jgi:hypothetical protein